MGTGAGGESTAAAIVQRRTLVSEGVKERTTKIKIRRVPVHPSKGTRGAAVGLRCRIFGERLFCLQIGMS